MRRIETWIVTTLFAFGIIVGMNYLDMSKRLSRITSEQTESHATQPVDLDPGSDGTVQANGNVKKRFLEASDVVESELLGAGPLQQGDKYLVGGNYTLALDHYAEYKSSTSGGESSLLLREAICLEKQKRFERAAKKYYRTISNDSNQTHQLIATAGLARCLLENQERQKALELLSSVALKLDFYEKTIPEDVVAQIPYQYARTVESLAIVTRPGLVEPAGVAFEDYSIQPGEFLSQVDEAGLKRIPAKVASARTSRNSLDSNNDETVIPGLAAEGHGAARQRIEILQRPSNSLNTISARISTNLEPVLELVAQIAAASRMNLQISQSASEVLRNRSKMIVLRARPLSTVLDQLLGPFELVWYQLDSDLHVVSRSELSADIPPNQFWFDAALRAMRQFEISFPDNERRRTSLLARANLNLIQNRLDIALNQYQELMQSQPRDELLAKLFFNQGKLQALLKQPQEASRLFYLAADQTLDPVVQASGYCLLGEIQLSLGQLELSVQSSRRGLATSINDHQRQFATLNLARAYLLLGEPFSANNILFKQQQTITDSDHRAMASILGAFARLNGTRDDFGIRVARNRLMRSVTTVKNAQYQSFADCYFAAISFRQLGFDNKAIDKLVLALSMPDVGQWQRQILYELAVLQKKTGNSQSATATLKSLVEVDDRWSLLALEQLASIYSDTDQTELCIKTCKQLWQANLTDNQKRSALELLGGAFQQKGEHHAAALCFAGMLPHSF